MTAEKDRSTDEALEAFFEALRDTTEEASPVLLARVLADAYEEQDAQAARAAAGSVAKAPAAPRRDRLRGLLDAIGGWPAAAGLATATLVGVWIGYNPPAALDSLTLALLDSSYSYGASLGSTLPTYDDLLADG